MKKYLTVLSLSLQDAFSERSSAVVWAFLDFLWPLATLFIWLAVYQGGQTTVGGINLSQMMTYYLGVAFINAAASSHSEWDIFQNIHSGELSPHLLRPFSYFLSQLAASISWKIVKGLLVLPLLIVFSYFLRQYLSFNLTLETALFLVLTLIFAYLLNYVTSFILGCLTFWLEDPTNVITLNDLFRSLFSGAMLPLILLPFPIQKVAAFLPYRYFYDFPLRILTGQANRPEIFLGLAGQLFWLICAFALYRFVWQKGLRAYCAFGS